MEQTDRPTNFTLVGLLAELGQVHLSFQREDDSLLAVAVFTFQDRQLLTVERTYRDGTYVIVDPTPEEIGIARSGDLWDLWNSGRARLLMGMC